MDIGYVLFHLLEILHIYIYIYIYIYIFTHTRFKSDIHVKVGIKSFRGNDPIYTTIRSRNSYGIGLEIYTENSSQKYKKIKRFKVRGIGSYKEGFLRNGVGVCRFKSCSLMETFGGLMRTRYWTFG